MLAYLEETRVASRAQVLDRFARDDSELVRGILRDLTDTGLVFSSGMGEAQTFRAATTEDLRVASSRAASSVKRMECCAARSC